MIARVWLSRRGYCWVINTATREYRGAANKSLSAACIACIACMRAHSLPIIPINMPEGLL